MAAKYNLTPVADDKYGRPADDSPICAGPECDRPVDKVGFCNSHHRQHWLSRPLTPIRVYRKSTRGMGLVERMEHYTLPANEHGCRYWDGPLNPSGYPIVGVGQGKQSGGHRVAWELANDAKIPKGMQIHHICGVRVCVEPSHLQLVTQRENIAEMKARNYYLARIKELEAALSQLSPDHPLLDAG